MSEDSFNLMEYAEEQISGGGRGNYITEIDVTAGQFVFTKGVPNEDRFWPFSTKEESEVAKAAALARIKKEGWLNSKHQPAKPFVAFRVALYADSVINRDEKPTWSNGAWVFYLVGFGDAYQEVFKPSFAPYAKTYEWGSKVWASVGLTEDPGNPRRVSKDADGNPELDPVTGEVVTRPNLVPRVERLFDSREEAYAAAMGDDALDFPPQPGPWKSEYGDWYQYCQAIYDADEGDVGGLVLPEYGVTPALVEKIRNQKKEDEVPF